MSAQPFTLRALREDDLGYVINSWRQGIAAESYLAKFDRDIYFRLMARHIKALTHEPDCVARVACDPEDESTILGFAIVTGDELHYVYVRQAMWKLGIARALLEGLPIKTYAMRTVIGERRIKPHDRGWAYAPRTMRGGDGKIQVEMA